ncbi:uncharacterized protein [Asterias amurensis]|uniref:uncharacterized protein n=1 Tax=Asterias amurensis TaxID=7602 RepID=UPI003AB437FB
MESLRPLQTLADLHDALSAARTYYNHSSAKVVTNKKHIRNSKKMAFKSSFIAKSNLAERSEPVDTKKQLEVDQAVAASDDRESEERHVQIFVSNPVKESLCLQLHPSTTISDLKQIIQERLNIQAKNQHLVTKRGIELCDTQSLMVLGIQQDTNLELRQVAGLMGGTRKRKSGSGQGKNVKIAKIQLQDEQETKTSSESKQEDVTESMETSCTIAGIPGTSTSAVQAQRSSPRTKFIPNPRGMNKEMKHQDQEKPLTQQLSASTEKQDCLVQSQRTSPRTEAIPKNTGGRKEQMKHQSREGLAIQQSASTEKQDCLVQSRRTSPRTGAIHKNTRGRKEQMKHQSREGLVTQQSASTEKQDCLVQSRRTSPRTGAIPKNTRGRNDQMKLQTQGLAIKQSASTEKQDCLLVQSQRTSPRTGAIHKITRGRKEQMKHQSREGLVTQQSASTEKQDCLVQSQRTSPRTGAIPKNTRGRKEKMKNQSREGVVTQQSASTEKQDCLLVQSQRTSPRTGAIHKNTRGRKEQMKHQSREGVVTQQSASTEKQDCLVQSQRTSPRIGAIPKNTRGRKVQMKPQFQTKEKNHLSASVHLLEEPEQSISSTAGIINEIASNCHSKDIVPAVHQDLATTSQSSDALTLVHHQSQAMVNNMSIGDGSNVFMAPASGITFNKNINHVTGTPDPSHQAQAISDELTEALKKVYMNTGSFVQMLPWVDDDQIHIMDIYTKLVLVVLNDKVGKIVKEKIQMKSYEDIFHLKTREDNLIKRVVFSGSAGLGKTTLCDKIAYDWAVGKSEILKRFELVFVLKMRSLTTATDLIDAVADQLIERDIVKRCDLKGFIDKNQDKVLILLDGFDEFQTTQTEKSSFGSILKALNRKQYKDCWVVITSRPPLDQLVSSSLVEKPFTHVEVEGFSAEDIEEYVNKFFPDDLENVRKLIEKIRSSEVLSDLAKSPMLLLLMCLLWRESGKLPETMTRLYTDALKYICRRKAKDVSQDEISQILISIGKVALHGLISTNQFLSFKEKDFDKKAFDAALSAGVLTSERVFKELDAHNNVYFIHKTFFLEFCAAMYWQSLINTEEFEDIFVRVCSATRIYPSPYEYLLRFCCGDNEECTNQVLQKLQNNENQRLGLICYFECQSKSLPSEDFINAVVQTEIGINGWNTDCLNAFFHLVKQIGNQTNFQDSAYLSSVNELSFTNCDLRRFDSELANSLGGCASLWATHLKRMKHLKNLLLASCRLVGEDMAPIAESVSDMPTLIDLILFQNDTLGSRASLWGSHLKRMKHLKILRLSNCKLIREDMAPIAESVSDMPTLIYLDLFQNDTLGGCALFWATHLKRMKHLTNLRLTYCNLKGKDMAPIAESMSDMPTLIDLNLSHNATLGGCASLWATHLKRMKHLKNLTMAYCDLKGEDVAPIAESVSDMPNLMKLDLSHNHTLWGCASLWATHLKRMKDLRNLRLTGCNLIGEDMAPIAESVSDMPNLMELDLSHHTLWGCASLWATHLKRMKHLKNLRLTNCNLLKDDMAPIAESVSDMPTLIDLDLSFNVFLGGRASLWATHLKRMKHLKNLKLTYCELKGKDIAPIAESVSDMPNLIELNLLGNRDLGGSATLWATHLKTMKHLKNLTLTYCNLRGKDVAPIAESVSDMPTLIDLNLSHNAILGGCASLWATHFKTMKHLKNLTLTYCNLKGKDMAPIAESMSDMPTLIDLNLSHNATLGGCASLWATHLKRMKHLKNLTMAYCDLKGEDVAPIAESVSDMPNLMKLDLSHNHTLWGCASLWATHLKRMKDLRNLRLTGCNLIGEDMAPIAESVSDMPNLMELDLSQNHTLWGCASLWATHLERMKDLRNLRLTGCNLIGEDMAPIAESVSAMPNLMELDLSQNHTLWGCASLWATHLKRMKHLKNLRLTNCNLLKDDMAPIAESVSDMPTLIDLDLSFNVFLGGRASLWATHLKRMKHLKNLKLTYCELKGKDIAPIAESVSDMPNLIELNLLGNRDLGGSATLWATHLKTMKHLKNLTLTYCNLRGKDVAPIAESVSDMPTLIDLNLSHNAILGGCASLWATHFKTMKHLKNLTLTYCNLKGKDMAPIAESMSDMPTLIDLNLSHNATLGGCASLWATHLKRMKHLKNLTMAYCDLKGEDVAPIAESVSDMPNLMELSLSHNHTLWGCASLWATHLKRMKDLRNLRLTGCNLIGEDMAPIAESVSDMPNLMELDLSQNHTLWGCASLWATHLKRMKDLRNLRLTGCNLIGEDMAPIAESVSAMPNLMELDLSQNHTLWGCASLWATHLKRMKHLKNLRLTNCNLLKDDMAPIAESVSDMPTLIDLDLSFNVFLGGRASLWATHLTRMKHLKNLKLTYCELKGKDIAPIAESVSDMPNLIELNLLGNRDLGGSATLWATHLKKMKHLKYLRLTYCILIGKDIAPIAESVNDLHNLIELDLSQNVTLGGSATLWATHLKTMKHLKNLTLTYCNLRGKDVAPIAESVSDMPTLIDLNLSHNATLGGCASLWATHLKRMKHLKNLTMAYCDLKGEDVAPIAESVSDMPNLMELDLSHNHTLWGCASLWATHLKRMKDLRNLRLTGCNLIGEDMAPIAESVSDMPNLMELDLSQNHTLWGCASLWATHLKRMKHLQNLGLRDCNLTGDNRRRINLALRDNTTLDVEMD